MARPPKERRIENIPEIKFFKPAGIPRREIKEVSLTMEEVEAIRLKDLNGLTQQEAAVKMEVSRPTFQRVLSAARTKIAGALLRGEAIRFEGGDYRLAKKIGRCPRCGYQIRGNLPRRGKNQRRRCPQCSSEILD